MSADTQDKHSVVDAARAFFATGVMGRQIAIAVALVTVIPLLAVAYVLTHLAPDGAGANPGTLLILLCAVACTLLGYGMLCRYPIGLARLRRTLEALLEDVFRADTRALRDLPAEPAIEAGLRLVAREHRSSVEHVEAEVRRVDGLLNRRLLASTDAQRVEPSWQYFRHENPEAGWIERSLSADAAGNFMRDLLDLVESAAVAYEQDGSLALGVAVSPWARALCQGAAPALFARDAQSDSGSPLVSEPLRSLKAQARASMQRGVVVDGELDCGLRGICAPVKARGQCMGVVGFLYGRPAGDPGTLRGVAERYGLAVADLKALPAPDDELVFIVSMAKNGLLFLARLIGESLERSLAEDDLRQHQNALEAAVQARTAELENTNAQLQAEVKERKRAEELKDEFVSTVSHELRTPLAITKEGIALLLDGIPGEVNDKQRKVLASARGNIDRLARIINDLLDISKIEAGKMQMAKDCVDFVALTEGVMRNFEGIARQKGLLLESSLDLPLRQVLADQDRIIQVMTNLLSNALKFTTEGGVRVTACVREEAVECTVADTGVGLAPEEAARVFEKFTQFGRTHGAGEKGTGLGLAIAKQIVELHRGRIRVESAVGRGSRFIFTLPLFSDDELVRETVEMAIVDARAQKDGFILLLFELDPRLGPRDGAMRDKYALGFRHLKEMENLVRSSDRMATRGNNQVVMVAKISPAQIALLYRRWKVQVATCFFQVDPALDVYMSCGYAEYPPDGSTAAELLVKAGQTLSPADGLL